VTQPGERPLHALRERGVEYVEVRCMDLQPELTVGIDEHTLRVLDVFLLWAMTSESPPDSPEEIRELVANQRLVAARGREPGLTLRRSGREVSLTAWAAEVMADGLSVARHLDEAHGTRAFSESWTQASIDLQQTSRLPSSRVLHAMRTLHQGEHAGYALAASDRVRAALLAQPLSESEREAASLRANRSWQAQAEIEASDRLTFEAYRQQFLDPASLVV
jgi:glutamate--cysteine ligase